MFRLTDGAARIFPGILSFILSQNKSPYGWGIPISQRERVHMAKEEKEEEKSPEDHNAIAVIRTHELLNPLDHGALPTFT